MIANFSKKQKGELFNEKFWFQAAGVAFLILAAYLLIKDFKIYQRKRELVSEISSYQKQIEDLQKSNQMLKEQISNADNADYLEKVAYEQLNVQKPGERQVIFVLPENRQKDQEQQQNLWASKSLSSWLSGVWSWIKSKF